MSETSRARPKMSLTYADLHVGMAFRSPGRTIGESDLQAFAGLTGDHSELFASNKAFRRYQKAVLNSETTLAS